MEGATLSGVMTIFASFISDFWNDQIVAHEGEGLFFVLVGFLGSFGFIRMSTRLMRSPRVPWWPGSVVSDSGVHLHHLVFGIWLMIGAGTLGFWFFVEDPWFEICALLFGIGAGLTVDEFALWVHLDDVYWAEEGRSSIDAAVIAVAAMGLVLLGYRPLDFTTASVGTVITSIAAVVLELALVAVCFLKQRVLHGAVGLFVFPIAVYGAARIGKPRSPWARRFYGERNPRKQAKAEERFAPERRTERLKERFRDAVGGTTGDVYEAKLAERTATQEAAAEVGERAERAAATGSKLGDSGRAP
jgi:hypothetical protein